MFVVPQPKLTWKFYIKRPDKSYEDAAHISPQVNGFSVSMRCPNLTVFYMGIK